VKRIALLATFGFFLVTAGVRFYAAQSATAVIAGVVLEAGTDRPMDRAEVLFLTPSDPIYRPDQSTAGQRTSTDAQGRFSIEVKPGRYRVVPAFEGFAFARPPRQNYLKEPGVWVQASAGERIQNVQLTVDTGTPIGLRAFISSICKSR